MNRAGGGRWLFMVVMALCFAILYGLVGSYLTRHQLWLAGTALGFVGGACFEGMRS